MRTRATKSSGREDPILIGVCDSYEVYGRGLLGMLQERWRAVELMPGVSVGGLSLLVVGFSRGAPPTHSPELVRTPIPMLAVLGDCSRNRFPDLLATYSPLSLLHRCAPRRVLFEAIEASLSQSSFVDRELDAWVADARSLRLVQLGVTDREKEVLELIVAGRSNKEIAVDLGISVSTVKFHVAGLLAKADAGGRTELAATFGHRVTHPLAVPPSRRPQLIAT